MSDAEKILKLIETVDPEDTAKLDEIDARVYCWINNRETPTDYFIINWRNDVNGYAWLNTYTRSRDALKHIRPNSWMFCIDYTYGEETMIDSFLPGSNHMSVTAKTEELAELHCIVQAIQYERTKS